MSLINCPTCKGSGLGEEDNEETTCFDCLGSGEIEDIGQWEDDGGAV